MTRLIDQVAAEARRYAEMYPQHSDGRNSFRMFAEWVDNLADKADEHSATAIGGIVFMRSESDNCVCCDGPHIFGMGVELENLVDGWGHPVTKVDSFVNRFATKKVNGVPIHEGKRVEVTVRIIDPENTNE